MRILGIPAEAGELVSLFRTDAPLKAHPAYVAAKAGDPAAAVALVAALALPLREKVVHFGPDALYVAPHALEASGENAIPQTLAAYLAQSQDAEDDVSIVQRNRVFHTGADAMQRLIAPSEFAGVVEAGRRYVLVDDVSTLGGTLADLAGYIRANGGVVAGAVVLANASRGSKIHPGRALLRQLEQRFPDEIRQLFGIELAALTAEEARYLIGFRTADELRGRALAAAQARIERLRAKGVHLEREMTGYGPGATS